VSEWKTTCFNTVNIEQKNDKISSCKLFDDKLLNAVCKKSVLYNNRLEEFRNKVKDKKLISSSEHELFYDNIVHILQNTKREEETNSQAAIK